jgi:hypothetical protein
MLEQWMRLLAMTFHQNPLPRAFKCAVCINMNGQKDLLDKDHAENSSSSDDNAGSD